LKKMTCDDRQGDCLHCSERAPGNCILFESDEMEYSCYRHNFSPTRPAIIEIVRRKLDRDPAAREQLKSALERVSMGGDGYVSVTDAISLANWLPQVFPDITKWDALDNVRIKDLKRLGEEILGPDYFRPG
jgi:hypothetical protein